jgi:tetratricopeptide (TPR) repeat protein
MNKINQLSIVSLLATIFLLPLFFIPSNLFTVEVSKITFLTIGVVLSVILFLIGSLLNRSVSIPREYMLLGFILIPLVYLISSLGSAVPRLSLFGYGFEVGTFGFIALAFTLFALPALVFKEKMHVVRAISAVYISLTALAFFALIKLITAGKFPAWKVFAERLSNPIGGWTDYAVGFGLLAILSALALGMLKFKKSITIFISAVFLLATTLLVIANFSTAFIFTLMMSVVIMIYLLTVEESSSNTEDESRRTKIVLWPAIVLCIVSLIFAINPMVSENVSLRDKVSTAFGLSNTYIRPSLDSTLNVTKGVIKNDPFFGSGPNTFERDWLLYKSEDINSTVFWNTAFPSGIGFLPTQVASVGIIGGLAWLLFFATFLFLGFRAIAQIPSDRWQRYAVVSTFFSSLFLWAISLVYLPGIVMLSFAFIFSGLFVAACHTSGIVKAREVSFSRNTILNFSSSLVTIALVIGVLFLGYQSSIRVLSLFHFQKALALSNAEGIPVTTIESHILKAIDLVPQDIYYSSLSRLNLAQAQSVVNGSAAEQESNKELFTTALQNSISAAQYAKDLNPANYSNWIALATLYSSLAPAPLSMEGALDSAKLALEEARKRNPTSPEIPLILATLEFDQGNNEKARTLVNESLTLKPDYADAYFLLAQIEIKEKNISRAIRSVETSALLAGNNAGLFFQLGLLRYENKDYIEAIRAFNSALQITPQYSNARYYLGLSLEKMGRHEDAIITFEDLARTNPDNAVVNKILENLKSGKDPLLGLEEQNQNQDKPAAVPISE